ncbi:MAG: Gfo/Idh/MocA family oxidoreductase, partial [Pseudomonadota bacterium]
MSDTEIRIGLIGAGFISTWHAEAIAATPGITLSAVCDVAPDAAHELADQFGATGFESIEDLLQSGLCDAVHILTPPDNHAELAIRALQAGMHVLVEKPVALTATEVQ